MEQYEYKKMNRESLPDVAYVVEKLTGKRLTPAYYQKKYITPWANNECQGWMAYDKPSGKVAAIVAALPLLAQLPDGQLDEWLVTLQKITRLMGLRKIFIQTYPGSIMNKKLSAQYTPRPSWSICCLATSAEMQPFWDQMRFGFGDFDTF